MASSTRLSRIGVAAAIGAALALPYDGEAQRRVPTADPEHPRLRFVDSLTSLNDRCMVRKAKLNPKMRPVYVNQQPVGFC
jgi:hypothetical protein